MVQAGATEAGATALELGPLQLGLGRNGQFEECVAQGDRPAVFTLGAGGDGVVPLAPPVTSNPTVIARPG